MTPIIDYFLSINPAALMAYLFFCLSLATTIGFQLGLRLKPDLPENGSDLVQQSLLTLLSFLLAFSVAMSEGRYEDRKQTLIDETNAISTSFLRVKFINGEGRTRLQSLMVSYLDKRIEFYRFELDSTEYQKVHGETIALEQRIWSEAVQFGQENTNVLASLLLASLNQMFDLGDKQDFNYHHRVPRSILFLLFFMSCLVSGLVGFRRGLLRTRHFLSSGVFLVAITLILFVILDLDRPLKGFIQLTPEVLTELRRRLSTL